MREDSEGLRRLGPQDDHDYDDARGQAMARRDAGLRQTRRLTAWTAAGLIAGVAASVGYFVHHPATSASTGSGGAVATSGAVATHGQKPVAGHAVVVSGGSGVTAGASGGAGGAGGSAGGLTWHDS